MSIHATAIIHPSAKIGKNVSIGPYSIIGPDTIIGDDCRIDSHVVLEYTELGDHCHLFPHVIIGLEPQHFKYNGEPTKVVIGPRCQFREGVTVHRGTALDKSITSIGSDGFFMALSHIAHDCVLGHHVIMANAAQLAGHVHIGNNTFISTMVGIHQFVRIGDGALVSGGAMVPLDVAPFCIAQGDRASIRGLNIVGLRRQGLSRESIKNVHQAFRIFFLSKKSREEALVGLEPLTTDPHVKTFVDFLKEPKRGFLRPASTGSPESESAE